MLSGNIQIHKNIPNPSILLYNITKDLSVFKSNTTIQRPIASISKLLTAAVALEYSDDLSAILSLSTLRRNREDLPAGKYTREDIFKAMLIFSDNRAADTLAEDFPGGRTAFIAAMNAKAQNLGMVDSVFADPHGYSCLSKNLTTVQDLHVLLASMVDNTIIKTFSTLHPLIMSPVNREDVVLTQHNLHGKILNRFNFITLSKTGVSRNSGYSAAMLLEYNDNVYSLSILGITTQELRNELITQLVHRFVVT